MEQKNLQKNNLSFDFSGQKVCVTGGTGGIGFVTVKKFLDSGATVFMVSSRKSKLDEKLEELSKTYGERAMGGVCDFSDSAQVGELIKTASTKMEGLDVLVCNAGMTIDSLLIKAKEEDFNKMMQIDLVSNFVLNRDAAKIMIRKRYGRIVNISSVVGLVGNMGQAGYSAAKAGLIGLTKTVAVEVAKRGVTANVVAPGFTRTAMVEKIPEEYFNKMVSEIPVGRQAEAEEISNSILFLSSKEASYITATTLNVSGGMVRS